MLAPTKSAVFAAVEKAKGDEMPVRSSLPRNTAGHEYSFWRDAATMAEPRRRMQANMNSKLPALALLPRIVNGDGGIIEIASVARCDIVAACQADRRDHCVLNAH